MERVAKITNQLKPSAEDRDLEGKVILITGGTQGLGAAIAKAAATQGASAICICGLTSSDVNVNAGKEVVEEVQALGAECMLVECDVIDPAQIERVVVEADRKWGRIDGLVNCVGDSRRDDLESTTVQAWDSILNINLRSHFLFTQMVTRVMKREKTRGSIVNICSVQAHGGCTFTMAYACAKAGLVCLTRNNAAELAKDGIRVNAVNMGWCATPNENRLQTAESGADWLEKADKASTLGRILRPGDISRVVTFLLSDRTFTTGTAMDLHPEYIHGMLGGGIGKAKDVTSK